ncbi:hypothetical protein [Rhizobium sp. CAU 1783]
MGRIDFVPVLQVGLVSQHLRSRIAQRILDGVVPDQLSALLESFGDLVPVAIPCEAGAVSLRDGAFEVAFIFSPSTAANSAAVSLPIGRITGVAGDWPFRILAELSMSDRNIQMRGLPTNMCLPSPPINFRDRPIRQASGIATVSCVEANPAHRFLAKLGKLRLCS